jgi:hypothetical protein
LCGVCPRLCIALGGCFGVRGWEAIGGLGLGRRLTCVGRIGRWLFGVC